MTMDLESGNIKQWKERIYQSTDESPHEDLCRGTLFAKSAVVVETIDQVCKIVLLPEDELKGDMYREGAHVAAMLGLGV